MKSSFRLLVCKQQQDEHLPKINSDYTALISKRMKKNVMNQNNKWKRKNKEGRHQGFSQKLRQERERERERKREWNGF